MGLLRDWHYIEKATEIPALSEMIREALIRALFTRNDRLLPRELIHDLTRTPAVTVKVKDDGEIRKLVQVLNGEETTLSLGLNGEDYNYFRTQLGVSRDREIGLTARPRILLTYDWIVPEQRGVQLDFSGYDAIEFPEKNAAYAVAQVGASWKRLYDEALAQGFLVPFVPTVPLDFAVGDAFWADAPLASYDGELATYVNALRTISAYGHRARIGFEACSNNGTAYDLVRASVPFATEFVVPVAAALRLAPKPAVRKVLSYAYDDPAKLSAAVDKLSRSGVAPHWVHIADANAWAVLHPGAPGDAFVVQVAVSGTAGGMPAKEKAADAALAGFKAKLPEIPSPYDVAPDVYAQTSRRASQSLFVGEVRLPASALGDFLTRLKAYAQQATTRPFVYAMLRSSGVASVFPAFEHAKDLVHIYDQSKGVAKVVEKVPGAIFVSRLAHLWSEDPEYVARMGLLRSLKQRYDTAHVIEPLVAP